MFNLLTETDLFADLIRAIEPLYEILRIFIITIPCALIIGMIIVQFIKLKLAIFNEEYQQAKRAKNLLKFAFISIIPATAVIVALEVIFAIY